MKTNYIAIDQGLANLGYAVFCQDGTILDKGILHTSKDKTTQERIKSLYVSLFDLKTQYNICDAACEYISGVNVRDTLKVMGIIYALFNTIEFRPTVVKEEFTGNKNATKKEMIQKAEELHCIKMRIKDEHLADALAIAYTYQKQILNKGGAENAKTTKKRSKTT